MNRSAGKWAIAFAIIAGFGNAVMAADMGTAFTYQGNLIRGGSPVTDTCDFRFGLWRDATSVAPADQVGTTQLVTAIVITTGAFTTPIDFGPGTIDGRGRWLEIEVQCPGDAAFVLLSPRVELTPAPHALALPGMRTPETATTPNVIGGTPDNVVATGTEGATIAGGGFYGIVIDEGGPVLVEDQNKVFDHFGTIGGGKKNVAGTDDANVNTAAYSTVAGGYNNQATDSYSAIGGGTENSAAGRYATIGGGHANNAGANDATVSGGFGNAAVANYSTVGGGHSNYAIEFASTVAGGNQNTADGTYATIPGGGYNQAGGNFSFAAGYRATVRNPASSGDGNGDEGTVVWSDTSVSNPFQSTGPNQFLIRAAGGVGIGTNSPDSALDVSFSGFNGLSVNGDDTGDARIRITNGPSAHYIFDDDDGGHALKIESSLGRDVVINTNGATERMRITSAGQVGIARSNPSFPVHVGTSAANGNGAHVTNGGTWVNGSDRNSKQMFEDIDKHEILERVAQLSVTRWQYRGEADSVRHIGPVAQDFHAAFGLGHDERYITTIDADGVALAAIQGLYEVVKEKECEIEEQKEQNSRATCALEAQNTELRHKNAELEARLERLEALMIASQARGEGP